jgi:hypothetical protein
MALLKDYDLPGTGVTVPNAYHVVTKVGIEKRLKDIEGPLDTSRPDQRTAGHQLPGQEINWKAGYIGTIAVTVWKDVNARNDGSRPLGFLGVHPSDNTHNSIASTDGIFECRFFIDIDSPKNHIEQAYDYLLSLPYYSGSTQI